ncbi:MAG TPA: SDR family oxidoreductase [Patescibacteria group bacterium]|nr:SDR family oxidoreductase [Patescibacteria group bacterium]
MQIKDKVAIVTGASSGIGLATAKLLAQKGAKVALVSRSKDKLEKLSKGLPDSLVVVADMSKPEEIKSMVQEVKKHFGRIDILVNNAGQGYDAPIEQIDPVIFHQIFDLDVVGPLVAMQQVAPIMRQNGSGSIVNISSGTALMALPNMAAYSSLKRALVGISLTAGEELKKDKISVSVIYPYITDTDFEKNTIKSLNSEEEGQGEHGGYEPPKIDSAEYIAEKIVSEGIEKEAVEVYAHEWMKK